VRPCAEWQGILAMHAVGSATDRDAAELQEHLDGCPDCRQDAVDVQTAAVALMSLGPAQVARIEQRSAGHDHPASLRARTQEVDSDPGSTPPAAPGSAGLPAAAGRRRRMAGFGAVLVAAAAALAAIVTMGGPNPSGPVRVAALTGQAGVRATVSLTPQPWGTGATLRESGQAPGQVLTVSMRTASGRWWAAGSYRTVPRTGSLVVELSCAVAPSQITDVWVSDQAGHTVLNGYVG